MVCRTGWFVDYGNLLAFESMIWFAVVLSFRRTIGFPNWNYGELCKRREVSLVSLELCDAGKILCDFLYFTAHFLAPLSTNRPLNPL